MKKLGLLLLCFIIFFGLASQHVFALDDEDDINAGQVSEDTDPEKQPESKKNPESKKEPEPASRALPLNPSDFTYEGKSALPTLGLELLDEDDEKDPIAVVDSILLRFIVNPIFFIAGGVAIIVVMYSAFRIITARGEEDSLTAAKNALIWAFAGLALIMLAYTLVRNLVEIIVTNV